MSGICSAHQWHNPDCQQCLAIKPDIKELEDSIRYLQSLAYKLANAIREHRNQKADDRCIEDDDRLYEALGDGIKCDRKVGNKEEMLANCKRFIENRCDGGKWPSYAELERERDKYFNLAADYSSKLDEWMEYTECSHPSACRKKLGLPEL